MAKKLHHKINLMTPSHKMVWFIAKNNNSQSYHLTEVSKESNVVKWSLDRKSAIQFETERSAHVFIDSYLKKRKDIYLIHALEETQ